MNSVFLITDQTVTLEELFFKVQARFPGTSKNTTKLFLVEDGENSRAYFDNYKDALTELEPEDLEAALKLMPDPRWYSIDYNDMALVKRILPVIADDPRVVVYNDAGTILPGPAFVRRLREEPAWDWFEEYRRNNP